VDVVAQTEGERGGSADWGGGETRHNTNKKAQ
jgi:hypothetical protein